MDSWCKGSEERVRWQRRIRSHQSPDANSDPGAHAGTDTDSEPDANSGAIGITESDSEPIDDTVGDSDAEHDVGTKPIDDTDPEHAAPAVPTACNRRCREQCDRCRGRASDCRSRHLLDASSPDDTPREVSNLAEGC